MKKVLAVLLTVATVIAMLSSTVTAQAITIERYSSEPRTEPCGNGKIVRTFTGNYAEIDPDNVATAEEVVDETNYGELVKRHATVKKPWVKNGKTYLPFTDQYLSSAHFAKFFAQLSAKGTIRHTKVGKLSMNNLLQPTTHANGDRITIDVSNTGKTRLTEVRLYLFPRGETLQIFADSDQGQVAYLCVPFSGQITDTEMETESIGLEDLSTKQLVSTDGARIGSDQEGNLKPGETVTVTIIAE